MIGRAVSLAFAAVVTTATIAIVAFGIYALIAGVGHAIFG